MSGSEPLDNPHGNVMKPEGIKPFKAYKNQKFLNSRAARSIRILCEYEETEQRLRREGIKGTVLFFGSARSKTKKEWDEAMGEAVAIQASSSSTEEERSKAGEAILRLDRTKWMCDTVEKCKELAHDVTKWCHENLVKGVQKHPKSRPEDRESHGLLSAQHLDEDYEDFVRCPVVVSTGGGPGLMEAANEGAASVKGARTIGMGITLPFEASLNQFVTPELAFEFHYFFTRKFWMMYHCQGLVVAPGGLGTMDELFEIITLKQTGKIEATFPIILFGPSHFWRTAVNWDFLVEMGTISQSDVDQLCFTDDVGHAKDVITAHLREIFAKPVNEV